MSSGFPGFYRRARIMLVIGILLPVLVFAFLASRGEVVTTEATTGRVLEVVLIENSGPGGLYRVKVEVEHGKRAGVFLPLSVPRPTVGDELPLTVEHYDDGDVRYQFDPVRWVGGGALQ